MALSGDPPDLGGWRFSIIVGGFAFAGMAAIGLSGGLYQFGAPSFSRLPVRLVSVIAIPALGEEAVFRGALVPDRSETSRPLITIAISTAIFADWHVVETTFLTHAAPIFMRPDFLDCAAVLGAGCAVIRWRTMALWPAVALHWLAVVVWQTWLGGPGVEALK